MLNRSVLSVMLLASCVFAVSAADNQLSEKEKAEGWELLFDGQDLSQWRNFKRDTLSDKWQAKDGVLQLSGAGGGDILTKKTYENFELQVDWKISAGGNSGIFVLVDETGNAIYSHAPEIQILDDARHSDNKIDSHRSGSLYDLLAAPASAQKPAENWNHVVIRLEQGHLQVWQNDVVTTSIVIGSSSWNTLMAASKFANWDGFAKQHSGHIGLQDHGDPVYFKNIKIKEL
ncbi:DUF1080 domain-containing protein [Bowmanella yangjiangensis]|uniref:DUF1080 domain-containing protein n=1 Tax=Bowmanella yangjiangensis TaxID=2811230 RepID=A0ABS3CQ77_9ALTE|nr:DUF1080 domain-containing protein [Bowmanella yangjiangensis]MBN7819253.1 DUF1080 domain-containing protein [Bowmanella yangjiangensis]